MKSVHVNFIILFNSCLLTNAISDARKIFGRKDVHIPDEVSKWVSESLKEMNNKFDKDPLQSVEFQCKNPATKRLLSMYPDAVIRWLHNGENIKVLFLWMGEGTSYLF